MDIWEERTHDNYQKIKSAFLHFGMPLFDMTENNFLHHKIWDVFNFGVPPSAIDLMLNVKGLEFNTTYTNATIFIDNELEIRVVHKNDLIKAKKPAGSPKDLDDLENL